MYTVRNRFTYKFLALILILAMLLTAVVQTIAADTATGGTLRLEKTENTVAVTNKSGTVLSILERMKLFNGYSAETAVKSYAWISLDAAKAVKLDSNTKVTVKESGKKLEAGLKSGKMFFNVTAPLKEDEELNLRTSTMVAGIRGSSGWGVTIDENRAEWYQLTGAAVITCADPLTGRTWTETIKPGERAKSYVEKTSPDHLDARIIIDRFGEHDVPYFAASEIRDSLDLQHKITEQTELSVPVIIGLVDSLRNADHSAQDSKQAAIDAAQAALDNTKSVNPLFTDQGVQVMSGGSPTFGGIFTIPGGQTYTAAAVMALFNQYQSVVNNGSIVIPAGGTLTIPTPIPGSLGGTLINYSSITSLGAGAILQNLSPTTFINSDSGVIGVGIALVNGDAGQEGTMQLEGEIYADSITNINGTLSIGTEAAIDLGAGSLTVQGGEVTMSGGFVKASTGNVIVVNGGAFNLVDGDVNAGGGVAIQVNAGTLNMSGGSANGGANVAINNAGTGGSVIYTGGALISVGGDATQGDIYNTPGGTALSFVGMQMAGRDSTGAGLRYKFWIQYEEDTRQETYTVIPGTERAFGTSYEAIVSALPSDFFVQGNWTLVDDITLDAVSMGIFFLGKTPTDPPTTAPPDNNTFDLGGKTIDMGGASALDLEGYVDISNGTVRGNGALFVGMNTVFKSGLTLDLGSAARIEYDTNTTSTYGDIPTVTFEDGVNFTGGFDFSNFSLDGTYPVASASDLKNKTFTYVGYRYTVGYLEICWVEAEAATRLSHKIKPGQQPEIRRLVREVNADTVTSDAPETVVSNVIPSVFHHGAPSGLARAADGAYLVTDLFNKVIWRVEFGKESEVLVGRLGVEGQSGELLSGYNDGVYSDAAFMSPWDIAPFLHGYLVSDSGNHCVRFFSGGYVLSAVGSGVAGYKDGRGLASQFSGPTGIASGEDGAVYIADTGNNRIRRLDVNGNVTTVAGDGTAGRKDGAALSASLNQPTGLAWKDGVLYIADTGNHLIRKLENGQLSTVAGTVYGASTAAYFGGDYKDGGARAAWFSAPTGVAVGGDGEIYVADSGNSAVRQIANGQVSTVLKADSGKGETYPSSPQGILFSGNMLLVSDPFAGVVFPPLELQFDDVHSTDWFYPAVYNAVNSGLMVGTGGRTFSPDALMTRAMAVTLLYKLDRQPNADGGGLNAPFTDVGGAEYYAKAVNWAAQSKIAAGDNGKFRPNAIISKQDMAVLIYNYFIYREAEIIVTQQYIEFADEDKIADYAKNAIQLLFKLGIIKAAEDSAVNPTDNVSRAEAAAMFDSLIRGLNGE